ncbi:hypothetical protein J6590_004316 [Homalodisca vitripennis]|nr:hypothetical protein J6590_004316 [Homalodisca vitripennis]
MGQSHPGQVEPASNPRAETEVISHHISLSVSPSPRPAASWIIGILLFFVMRAFVSFSFARGGGVGDCEAPARGYLASNRSPLTIYDDRTRPVTGAARGIPIDPIRGRGVFSTETAAPSRPTYPKGQRYLDVSLQLAVNLLRFITRRGKVTLGRKLTFIRRSIWDLGGLATFPDRLSPLDASFGRPTLKRGKRKFLAVSIRLSTITATNSLITPTSTARCRNSQLPVSDVSYSRWRLFYRNSQMYLYVTSRHARRPRLRPRG